MTGAAIRRLAADDIGPMRAMLAMMGRAFDEVETYTGAQPDDAYLRRLLSGGQFSALAALAGEQARSEIYIYDLAVDAACRRRGIATSLIDELRRVARERGAWVIYVQADPPDAPAMALYTRLGTREDVCHFDIAVR